MRQPSQFSLLTQRRFAPFFWTQFLGAFNDNLFKTALLVVMTYDALNWTTLDPSLINNLIPGLFNDETFGRPPTHPDGLFPPHLSKPAQIFFSFYFALTGIHALHMIVGVGIMLYVAWLARRNEFTPDYYNPVEIAGLYWHFVDIVWIFLFPLLYLIGRHYHHG